VSRTGRLVECLGNPNIRDLAGTGAVTLNANADAFAERVLPMIADAQRRGHTRCVPSRPSSSGCTSRRRAAARPGTQSRWRTSSSATAPIDSNGATASLAVADDLLDRVAECTQGEARNPAGRDLGRTALTELRSEIWVELMAKWAIGAIWGSPAARV
jgi:hypothetical protein